MKKAGRKKGVPNKVTAETRVLFQSMLDELGTEVLGWIRSAAKADPGRGAELVLKLAEFCVPKVARHEFKGDLGKMVVEFKGLPARGEH